MMQADDEQLPSRILFPADSDDHDDVMLNVIVDDSEHHHNLGTPTTDNSWYGYNDGGPADVLGVGHVSGRTHNGGASKKPPLYTRRRTSPLTVTGHPTMDWEQSLSASLSSTITMSDEGAEVTLELASLSLGNGSPNGENSTHKHTKHQQRSATTRRNIAGLLDCRGNSLLDTTIDTATTTPSPTRRNKQDSGMNLCCGLSTGKDWQSESPKQTVVFPSHLQVEETISAMLEQHGGGAGCSAWQGWSYFGLLGSVEETATTTGELKEDIRSVLRNRAFDMSARKQKIRRLRDNLNPFAAPTTPEKLSPSDIYKSKSFSIKDHAPGIVRVSKMRDPSASLGFSGILSSCTLPQQALVPSPEVLRSSHHHDCNEDDDACYDSDPEDFTRRRSPLSAPHQSSEGDGKENHQNYHRYSYPRHISSAPSGAVDLKNDKAYGAVIQEFMNETTTLLLYPSTSKSSPSSPPLAVNVWIERGQRLQTMIQPKLMWKPIHRVTPPPKGQKRMILPIISSMELLDITRILKVGRIDREQQPFAKPMHCFVIKTIDNDEFFFEAKSFAERNRLVYSLKLLVARFGAKIIVADGSLFDEFFISGDSPAWEE